MIDVATCSDCGKTYKLDDLNWHKTTDYGVEHLKSACPECGTYYLRNERYTRKQFEKLTDKEFRINKYLSLRLEDGTTQIYVCGKLFTHCKYLLLNIRGDEVRRYDNINSIDEIKENYDHYLEREKIPEIDSRTEFIGHCSNIQAWYEHNYDTRLIDSRLGFPLLRRLTKAGDPLAKRVFKDEIAKRVASGYEPVIEYLYNEGYFKHFNKEEIDTLLENIENISERIRYKIKFSEYAKFRFDVRPLTYLDDKKSNMSFYSISEFKNRFKKLKLSSFEAHLYKLKMTSGNSIKYCYFMIAPDLDFLQELFKGKNENCKLGISNPIEDRYNYFIDYDSKIVIDFPTVSMPLEKFNKEMSKRKRLKARAERLWEKYNLTDKIKS